MSIVGWGVGSFVFKFANTTLHPLMVSAISLATYLIIIPFAFLLFKFDHTLNLTGVAYAVVGSLFMCAGTLGFSFALRNGGEAGSTTALSALYPALTMALSCLFLAEPFTIKKGIGMIFVLISFVILS
jgi:uncharacterized membrane protein